MRLEDIEVVDKTETESNEEETESSRTNDSEPDNWKTYNDIAEYIPESARNLIMTATVLKIIAALCFISVLLIACMQFWILVGSITGAAIILLITSFLFDVIADISISTARTNALIALQTKMML